MVSLLSSLNSQRARPLMMGAAAALLLFTMLQLFSRTSTGTRALTSSYHPHNSYPFVPRGAAANATLGFEKILALSPRESWRTRGLKAAADLVGIDITIPTQPQNYDNHVKAFQSSRPGARYGSAKAWIAHLDMLKFVISSGWESALIIEDDLDFDVNIRYQTQAFSDAIRAFNAKEARHEDQDNRPYGGADQWDILWLGHCGSGIDDASNAVIYEDPTRVTNDRFTYTMGEDIIKKIPEGHRQVQHYTWEICSWAYAVTKKSAPKVLKELAQGTEAFDVSMTKSCNEGRVRCLTIVPTLFSAYDPAAEEGYATLVNSENFAGDQGELVEEEEAVENEHMAQETRMGSTANLAESARCLALFDQPCLPPPMDRPEEERGEGEKEEEEEQQQQAEGEGEREDVAYE